MEISIHELKQLKERLSLAFHVMRGRPLMYNFKVKVQPGTTIAPRANEENGLITRCVIEFPPEGEIFDCNVHWNGKQGRHGRV